MELMVGGAKNKEEIGDWEESDANWLTGRVDTVEGLCCGAV